MSLKFSFRKGTSLLTFVLLVCLAPVESKKPPKRERRLAPTANSAQPSQSVSNGTQTLGYYNKTTKKFTYDYGDQEPRIDIFNQTVHRVNDSNASYFMSAPQFYNGTHYFDGKMVFPCVQFRNGSNGTNCSKIYGDLRMRGYYEPTTIRCQSVLMQSYGFEGIPISNKTKSGLCPHIVDSCCTHQDFFNAFRSWEHDGVHSNLIERVNFLNNTYNEYLSALISAHSFISNIGPKIPVTNNCKVLSNTIMAYNMADVASYLMSMVRQYFAYLSKNFESFYCTMCDADSHAFFDLTRQHVVFGHKQCRTWAKSTLPFLLYFHVHMVKINNLIVDFMSSCDVSGAYTKMHIDESLFKLQVARPVRKELMRCRNEKDTSSWYKACLPVCREMSLTRINAFMTPNLRKMTSIASFIKGNLQILKNQLFNNMNSEQVSNQKANNARVLSVKKLRTRKAHKPAAVTRRMQQNRPIQKYNHLILRTMNYENFERNMIPTALNALVDLDHLTPAFVPEGLDLDEVLETMSFVESSYRLSFTRWADLMRFDGTNLTVHMAITKLKKGVARMLGVAVGLLLLRLG